MSRSAATVEMDGPGDEFFACATFTQNQHRGIRRCHRLDQLAQLLHLGRIADDVLDPNAIAGTGLEGGIFGQ